MDTQSIQFHPSVAWSLSMLSNRINYVQKQVEKVIKTQQSETQELELRKRELKQAAASGIPTTLLEQQINEIMKNHKHLLEEINKLNAEAIIEKKNIDLLNITVTNLDREIARIQADHTKAVVDLREKREKLKSKLNSIVDLNEMISAIESKRDRITENYNKEIEEMKALQTGLTERTDLNPEQMETEMQDVQAAMEEISRKFNLEIEYMKKQKTDMEIESAAIIQNVDKSLKETFVGGAEDCLQEIKLLENLKLQASPSKQKAFDKSLSFYRSRITEEELRQNMTLEEKLNAFLKQHNLHMSPTGEILDANGKPITKAFMKKIGLQEALDKFLIENSGLQYLDTDVILTPDGRVLSKEQAQQMSLFEKFDISATVATEESIRSDMSSRDSEFLSEDAVYLKKYVGVPLTLALGEIAAKQPRDPIHYLGHWLFKYRYNQEVEQYKKQEVEELTRMRNKIAQDKWNQFVQDEAKKTILDIVERAEIQGDKNEYNRELQRITDEADAMENEEDQDALDEEARDTLGEYNGPTVTQRRTPNA